MKTHDEAVRLRKMTDEQLIEAFRNANREKVTKSNDNSQSVKKLLEELSDGKCKGIKGATAYKIVEYATQRGFV